MKLRNKKTGEIGEPRIAYQEIYIDTENHMTYCYKTLLGVFEEWEDYEEPKEYWYITDNGDIENDTDDGVDYEERVKEIGNYFETKEEAEKAVEKLKAWKRLKDKRFEFKRWCLPTDGCARVVIEANCVPDIVEELDILFGGEE